MAKYQILINKCLFSYNTKIPENENITVFEGQLGEDHPLYFMPSKPFIVFGSISNMYKIRVIEGSLSSSQKLFYYLEKKVCIYLAITKNYTNNRT